MENKELYTLTEARESFSDSIHQAVEDLETLKGLAGKSTIAYDFQWTTIVLKDLLMKTNQHIADLKQVVREEAETVAR